MKTKCIDSIIPQNYSCPNPLADCRKEVRKIEQNGKTFELIGVSEKDFTFPHRVWVGVRAVTKTIFTVGLALCSEDVKDDLKSAWKGKRAVLLYSSDSFSAIKDRADRGDAMAQATFGFRCHSNDEARKYFRLAAVQGNEQAMLGLGGIYVSMAERSEDIPRKEINEYLQLAATSKSGNIGYLHNLGNLLNKLRILGYSYSDPQVSA